MLHMLNLRLNYLFKQILISVISKKHLNFISMLISSPYITKLHLSEPTFITKWVSNSRLRAGSVWNPKAAVSFSFLVKKHAV